MLSSVRSVFCAAGAAVLVVGYAIRAADPPQPFTISISTVHDTFKSGAEIMVGISLKNPSDKSIPVIGACAPKADVDSFRIEVKDAEGKVAPETDVLRWLRGGPVPEPKELIGGTSGPACGAVPPKGFINTGFVLNRFYDLIKPGKYTIQVQCEDPGSKVLVKSNTITVTVTP
ncbi:MAG TPA: hypothetical protein VGT03_09200 [Candidatus Acidoferrales bacterium]|nr:hypothetical protein [Candidatus Acidoferrales bacterium]